MEKNQLDGYRSTLTALKAEIEQLHCDSQEATGTVVLDQSKVGRLSRMDALQAQQMAQETARGIVRPVAMVLCGVLTNLTSVTASCAARKSVQRG